MKNNNNNNNHNQGRFHGHPRDAETDLVMAPFGSSAAPLPELGEATMESLDHLPGVFWDVQTTAPENYLVAKMIVIVTDRDRKLGDFTLFRGHSCNQLHQGLVIGITQLTMSHQLVKNPVKRDLFQKEAGESVFQSDYFGPRHSVSFRVEKQKNNNQLFVAGDIFFVGIGAQEKTIRKKPGLRIVYSAHLFLLISDIFLGWGITTFTFLGG